MFIIIDKDMDASVFGALTKSHHKRIVRIEAEL